MLQLGNALFQGGKNEFDAFYIARAAGTLETAAQAQLDAVKVLSDKLQHDVRALQNTKTRFQACSSSADAQSSSAHAQIIYFSRTHFAVGSRGSSIEVEWPDPPKAHRSLSVGLIHGSTEIVCNGGYGGPRAIYTSTGRYVRLDTTMYMSGCHYPTYAYDAPNGSLKRLDPGTWRVVVCNREAWYKKGQGCVKTIFVNHMPEVVPAPLLFTTTVVIAPPAHNSVLIQLR